MGSEQEGRSASMTVKEVEERTGLPRANIRYYESEGLIHPARGENGYRDYHSLLLFWRRGRLRAIPMASTPASATGAPPRAA